MNKPARIAIVDKNKCKPNKCKQECKRSCPPQKQGKEVFYMVDIEDLGVKQKVAKIAESLCVGCNICVKQCPFDAIKIINIPHENPNEIVYRYGPNSFRLYRLPILKKNQILGIVGQNGIGKSTIIGILSGLIRPNFEKFNKNFSFREIINKFQGNVVRNYLSDLYANRLKISIKPQKLRESINLEQTVHQYLFADNLELIDSDETKIKLDTLLLFSLLNNEMKNLSGGELQRVVCLKTILSKSNVYIFDEPTNFLDIKQRLIMSRMIHELSTSDNYIIVIDHDLSMLDYLSDEICIMYGVPGAYGIISHPMKNLAGLNTYLNGYIQSENVRFRDEGFNLKPTNEVDNGTRLITDNYVEYDGITIEYSNYSLTIKPDKLYMTGINVIVGENGNGKTTYINYLSTLENISVSYKRQMTSVPTSSITVLELFHNKIRTNYLNEMFKTDVVKPLIDESLLNKQVNTLSGGELQKVMIVLCLGIDANIYLIDEPSANLDIESRLTVLKVIKRYIMNHHKCVYIIEHDLMMVVSLAQEVNSRMLMIEKTESLSCRSITKGINSNRICNVSDYMNFGTGINKFLDILNITMRTSNESNRPRINKLGSQLDKEQRTNDTYYA
jgi:ATP-binding cassette subfamily E protein 1